MDGKLELLFAHLSMNNIIHIRPLLFEAIDEYQEMCKELNYDERRKISFIKTLLWHAERGEWTLARECLRGAEAVYQGYLRKKMFSKPEVPKFGYMEIHGPPQLTYQNKSPRLDTDRGNRFQTPIDLGSARSVSTSGELTPGISSPRIYEQGQMLVTPRKQNGYLSADYPGSYVLQHNNITVDADVGIKRNWQDQQLTPRTFTVAHADDDDVTKVKRSLADLFDIEWRHAMMTLKRLVVMEDNILKFLADILLESYKLSDEEAQRQVLEFESAALKIITDGKYTQVEKGTLQNIGDSSLMVRYRNNVSHLSVKRLQDTFLTKVIPVLLRKYELKADDVIDHYARACVSVTWYMTVQDPPYFLVDDRKKQLQEFDLKLYRPYSKVGRLIESIVWPPLKLHKEGRLLTCGYAQGNGCT